MQAIWNRPSFSETCTGEATVDYAKLPLERTFAFRIYLAVCKHMGRLSEFYYS